MEAYQYDELCVLRGQIYTDYFYGRPNFGENPELDELEHSIFIALDKKIDVLPMKTTEVGDYRCIPHTQIEQVQLTGNIDVTFLRDLRGQGVEVSGKLFSAHTGHHHTPLLISLETSPKSIDERYIYPGSRLANTGTGFLLGQDGLIVTAAHIITGRLGITITRGLYRQKVVVEMCDTESDIAILRIPPSNMDTIIKKREAMTPPVRSWLSPQLGEKVYSFGFPLRPILPHSLNMTQGIVSAEWTAKKGRFQITAPIQCGNSGGPIIDACGNLIGIVTSFSLPNSIDRAENVNFAIQTKELLDACRFLEIEINSKESNSKIGPRALGKIMQHICVEIECWK